jgi:hypothetical protein
MKLSEINHLAEKQKQDPVNDKGLDKLEWILVGCLAICSAAVLWANWGI